MTPAEGRAEWAKWAARADELRRDEARLREIARDSTNVGNASMYLRNAATYCQLAANDVDARLDALREFAPKETT